MFLSQVALVEFNTLFHFFKGVTLWGAGMGSSVLPIEEGWGGDIIKFTHV